MVTLQTLLEWHSRQARQFMTIHCTTVTSIKYPSYPLDDACCSPPLSWTTMIFFASFFPRFISSTGNFSTDNDCLTNWLLRDMTLQLLGNLFLFSYCAKLRKCSQLNDKTLSIVVMVLPVFKVPSIELLKRSNYSCTMQNHSIYNLSLHRRSEFAKANTHRSTRWDFTDHVKILANLVEMKKMFYRKSINFNLDFLEENNSFLHEKHLLATTSWALNIEEGELRWRPSQTKTCIIVCLNYRQNRLTRGDIWET